MPTFVWLARFGADFKSLTPAQQAAFLSAVEQFVGDLSKGGQFRKGLRVKGVRGAPGIFEMTWADDGRATFQYGEFVTPGEPHVIWRRNWPRRLRETLQPRRRPYERVGGS